MLTDFPLLRHYWFIVCRSADLRRHPLERTLLGEPLVIFRDRFGKTAALRDRCSHRNVPLSAGWIEGDCLVCPYHGWSFDRTGRCRTVPGLAAPPLLSEQPKSWNIPTYPVAEQDGFVWVCLEPDTTQQPSTFPFWREHGYISFIDEIPFAGSLPDALENFLDGTHTHYVHSGLVRRSDRPRRAVTAIVRHLPNGVEAEYLDEGQQSGLIAQLAGADIDATYGRFLLPSIAQLEYRSRTQVKLSVTFFFTPETMTTLRLYALVSGRAPAWAGGPARLVGRGALRLIAKQDRAILAQQLANLQRFGEARYAYTEIDVLGQAILHLLKWGPRSPLPPEQRVTLHL